MRYNAEVCKPAPYLPNKKAKLGGIYESSSLPTSSSQPHTQPSSASSSDESIATALVEPSLHLPMQLSDVATDAVTSSTLVLPAAPKKGRGKPRGRGRTAKAVDVPAVTDDVDTAEQTSSSPPPLTAASVDVVVMETEVDDTVTPTPPALVAAHGDVKGGKNKLASFNFKCPYHQCFNCYPFYKTGIPQVALLKCIYCPRAYHPHCFPPDMRFNATYLVCPAHGPDQPLPSCEGVKVMSTVNVTHLAKDSSMSMVWDAMVLRQDNPDANDPGDDHFCLPVSIKEGGREGPRPYKHITKLQYRGEKTTSNFIAEERCSCKDECGPSCYNRHR